MATQELHPQRITHRRWVASFRVGQWWLMVYVEIAAVWILKRE